MLRRVGIRSKILGILVVPIAVLVLGALLVSLFAFSNYRTASELADLVSSTRDMRSVVESLQNERYVSTRQIEAVGDSDAAAEENGLDQSRWLTDEALESRRERLSDVDLEKLHNQFSVLLDDTSEMHGRLEAVRERIDSEDIDREAIFDAYNDIIRSDINFAARLSGIIDQRGTAQYLSAYATLDELVDLLRQEGQLGELTIEAGKRAEGVGLDMYALVAQQDVLISQADRELDALDSEARLQSAASSLPSMRLLLQTGSADAIQDLDADAWNEAIEEMIASVDLARVEAIESAIDVSEQSADSARNQALLIIIIGISAVVLSIISALIVPGRILRPLRKVARATERVSRELPRLADPELSAELGQELELQPIDIESRDEIGQLGNAFNEVNQAVVDVAREQIALRSSIAEIFVNVARRDQVLLNRQLALITELERTEEDPTQLEELFRLDHLATRMRRNAESLLVLAGVDSGRRVRQSMAVSDVVRTASSEIEHYDRVDLVITSDPAILGHVALSVAHLLAELMENATVFSDPGSRVEVMTSLREDGVAISITDDGLGMDPELVSDVNAKIQTSGATQLAGSQRLGLFVVGRLASRHDISVELFSAGEGEGTRAEILVPSQLLDPRSLESEEEIASPAKPEDVAVKRSSLFSEFHSHRGSGASRLDGIDLESLAADDSMYVPVVTEDRDSDLQGLSRDSSTQVQISYDNAPIVAETVEPAESAETVEPVEEVTPSEETSSNAEKEVRVYTGAFPTATGEYPVYTGEFPAYTGQQPSYPSRRSRREARTQEIEASGTVDHHVEFETPEVEELPEVVELAEPNANQEQQPEAEPAPVAPEANPEPQPEPVATPERVEPVAPETEIVESVVVEEKAAQKKAKRPRRGLFSRKKSEAAQEPAAPVRESIFPTSVSSQEPVQQDPPVVADGPIEAPNTGPVSLSPTWSPQTYDMQEPSQDSESHLPQQRFESPADDTLQPGSTPELQSSQGSFESFTPTASEPQQEHSAESQFEPQVEPVEQGEPESAPSTAFEPAPYTPATSWAPTNTGSQSAMGMEAAEELRRRSAMTSEVLSELSQLSTYQPEAQQERPAESLTKRVPSEIPKPAEPRAVDKPPAKRDASQVRSMLSGFQAGVRRAANVGADESVQNRKK